MIVDGEWSLDMYRGALGTRLSASRLPKVSATGEWPRPFLSGTCLMITRACVGDRLTAARLLVTYATRLKEQAELPGSLGELPVLVEALQSPGFSGDPVLSGAARQMEVAAPLPGSPRMPCIWRAVKSEMRNALEGDVSPRDTAGLMQASAVSCLGQR